MDDYDNERHRRRKNKLSATLVSVLRRATARWSQKSGWSSPKRTDKFEFSHRDKTDSTRKRSFRVQMPRRLLYYTTAVFLILPIFCFLWKETHLSAQGTEDLMHHPTAQLRGNGHDRFPSWMESEGDEKGKIQEKSEVDMEAAPDSPPLDYPKEENNSEQPEQSEGTAEEAGSATESNGIDKEETSLLMDKDGVSISDIEKDVTLPETGDSRSQDSQLPGNGGSVLELVPKNDPSEDEKPDENTESSGGEHVDSNIPLDASEGGMDEEEVGSSNAPQDEMEEEPRSEAEEMEQNG